MGARRRGRELALQALYQLDMTSDTSERALADFWRSADAGADTKQFATALVDGVLAQRAAIDEHIVAASENWALDRLSRVDLHVLRIGTYELTATPEVPVEIVINEAIEVARRFGSADSPTFVNGVLDAIAERLGRKREEKVAHGDG
jgi:N utilization substance protein B